jgi:catechol 2,3-dioxygenase-like lactoylglutathione lyase family enzyme
MFDRVTIRASDPGATERFYRTVLGELGVEPTESGPERIAWDDFAIVPATAENPATRALHLGFVAPSRERVDAFWWAGTEAGYEDEGPPGERPQYTPGYYGAFLRDPDGNSAEAVHHADVRRGGNIDHLWIRVGDLDAATSFYAKVARHTGLREGRRWEHGRQFRGAWATFSLVADGAPVTENLHLAFPAPDRRTVEDFHDAATAAAYPSNREPHLRDQPGAYSAQVIGPDGMVVESIRRDPGSGAR